MNRPSGPNPKQKADYDKMSKMSGADFDKTFAPHMVADHQKDIAEYKKASKTKDAAGEYASGQIDTLQKAFGHREIAEARQVIWQTSLRPVRRAVSFAFAWLLGQLTLNFARNPR